MDAYGEMEVSAYNISFKKESITKDGALIIKD